MTTEAYHPFRSQQDKAEYEAFYLERAKAWPIPAEARFVDTASGRTFVRVSGRESDPPLVLLPGMRGTSLMWIGSIAALSARYRTYAIDTITDIGLSVLRRDVSTPQDLVDWMDEVFTALFPEGRFNLAGMSYGGWLASQYALQRSARLKKVVMLAPGATVLRMSPMFMIRVLVHLIPIPGLSGGPFLRTLRWVFEDTVRSGEAGRTTVEVEIAEMLKAGRFFVLPRMIWPTVLTDDEWRRFSVPALYVVGENEKIYSASAAVTRLHRVAPQIGTEVIPGVGHDLTLLKPGQVARKVLEFLDGTASRSIER